MPFPPSFFFPFRDTIADWWPSSFSLKRVREVRAPPALKGHTNLVPFPFSQKTTLRPARGPSSKFPIDAQGPPPPAPLGGPLFLFAAKKKKAAPLGDFPSEKQGDTTVQDGDCQLPFFFSKGWKTLSYGEEEFVFFYFLGLGSTTLLLPHCQRSFPPLSPLHRGGKGFLLKEQFSFPLPPLQRKVTCFQRDHRLPPPFSLLS